MDNEKIAEIAKALSDPNRIKILQMLSENEELCACKILERFEITQPTLSHHMKSLCEAGLVTSSRVGKWMYYELQKETLRSFSQYIETLTDQLTD